MTCLEVQVAVAAGGGLRGFLQLCRWRADPWRCYRQDLRQCCSRKAQQGLHHLSGKQQLSQVRIGIWCPWHLHT